MSEIIKVVASEQQAIVWRNEIGKSMGNMRRLIIYGYELEVWRPLGYASMTECLRDIARENGLSENMAWRELAAGKVERILDKSQVGEIPESHLRPLTGLKTDEDKREAWRIAKQQAPNGKVTGKVVQQAVQEVKARTNEPKQKGRDFVTLAEWNAGQRVSGAAGITQFNRVNENIEWAAWSWNPVTGCLHNCAYCYARDIANRFYDQGFEPAFIPSRLNAPFNTRQIAARWDGDTGNRNVFVCSMADLFGKWVPEEWILEVLKVISQTPQWNYLLLTKFPVRMAEFDYPANVWLGTSVDRQHAVHRAQSAFEKVKASGFAGVCWLSCEPMLERLTFDSLEMFDWVVMGGASKSTQTAEYWPPFDDVLHLYQQARAADCRVYMKTNLLRLREFPA